MGAVCLCVAMVLIVFSVMDGFLQMVRDRSRGMLGDLVMENGALQGFPYYQEFIDQLKNDPVLGPRIHQATPVIISYGVLRFPKNQITKPAQIVGIRLEETYEVNDFKKGLFYEKYYPGTTTLGQWREPAFGLDANQREVLPADLEAAYQRWLSQASPAERMNVPLEDELPYKRPGYYRPIPLEERVSRGSAEPCWFGPLLPCAILGTDMCARRQQSGKYIRYYWRGEPVQLTLVPMPETGKIVDATGMPSRPFRYVDDCRTGVYDIDSMSVYVDFDYLQKVLDMSGDTTTQDLPDGTRRPITIHARATQVQIKLTPEVTRSMDSVLETRRLIEEKWKAFMLPLLDTVQAPELLRDVEIKTWEEKQARFIAAVEKEKYLVTILFGIISVVAVLLVGCIFYMIVQEKTRDIGIIKSVGATSLGVANIFITYGAAVGVVGGALGTLFGTVFVRYINEIQDLLIRISPSAQIWNPEVYTFDRIPNQVNPWDAAVIYVIAIIASMVGSLIAAMRAARVWPVEALRYE